LAAIMRKSFLLTQVCLGVLTAVGLWCDLTIAPARAGGVDVARAALLAKAGQQCAAAIGLFDEALRQGGFSAGDEGLLIYSRGVCYENLGVKQKALSDLNSAVALLPNFADAYAYRGIVWGELREFDRAIADFEQAKRFKPSDPLLFNNLGNAYAAKEQPAQAIANYTRAIELRRDYAEAFYNRAAVYLATHDDTKALADYDEAIRLEPSLSDAYSNRGVLKLSRDEVEPAISDFDVAIRLNRRDAQAWLNRAHANLLANRLSDATDDFSHVIEIDQGNAAAYLGRGRVALFSGESGGGIEDFLTAHRLLPTSAFTVLWLHIARTHRGEDDEREFIENSERVAQDVWPGILLRLFEGKASPEDVRRVANAGPPRDKSGQTCEVEFYIGEYAAHHRPPHEARELLLNAVNQCQPQTMGFVAAKAELGLLGQ
jgi:tetratricopeptide (TPR) repeat protein